MLMPEDKDEFYKALYLRTPFSENVLDVLKEVAVGIVGLGSGGSLMASSLARAGVCNFKFADPAKFTLPNVSRHELDLESVDKHKVECMKEKILRMNPHANITTYPCDLFDERNVREREEFFDNVDIIVAAADKTSVQLLVNYEAVSRKIDFVAGGCFESAFAGEVLYWIPNKELPCLECLRGSLAQPNLNGKIDYSTAQGPEDYEGEPGLYASIIFITSIEVSVILAVLLRNTKSQLAEILNSSSNYLLIGGALAKGFYRFRKPFDIFWQPLSGRRRSCSTCRTDTKQLDRSELKQLEQIPSEFKSFLE